MTPGYSLTLQITGSATAYLSLTANGTLNVTSTALSLPTIGAGAGEMKEPTVMD